MYRYIILFIFHIFCLQATLSALSYQKLSNGYFTSIHILVIDPKEHEIMPVRAVREEISRESVLTLAQRHNAVAAINGGYWKSNGAPAGALKIANQWLATPFKPRGAIGWSLINKKVLIDRILTNYSIDNCPEDAEIEVIPVSDPPHTAPEEWKELEHIVGGTPVLIRDGQMIEDYRPEQILHSFLIDRHPRTAIGIRNNGDWIFVVVDGHPWRLVGGMNVRELSQLMLDLGCIEALNLDGGGSSTMILEGTIINDPCGTNLEQGKKTSAVSDAILIF